jgi:cytochrome c biogenesis protein CcmG/thiol:disulfide interchange protein DsbE
VSHQRRERQAARRDNGSGRSGWLRAVESGLWLVVVAAFVWRITPQVRAAVGPKGGAAPPVILTTLDGSALALHDLRGQVVLVNFWATWCPPCRAEMPGFQAEYRARHSDGFTVVGISLDQTATSSVVSFLGDHDITYPVAMATPDAVAAFGGVNDLPTSFLLDRHGRLRYTVRGVFDPAALRTAVDRLLAEPT